MAAKRDAPARYWVFTLNNPTGLLDWDEFATRGATGLRYQLEVGEEGTEHFQGMLCFRIKKTFGFVRDSFTPEQPHIEKARDPVRAWEYCAKEDTRVDGPWEYGEGPIGQGKRNDLIAVKAAVDDGADRKELEEAYYGTMIRFGKQIMDYKRRRTPERNFKTITVVFIGPAGTQKSTLMKLIAPWLGTVYRVPGKKGSGLYFDDYDGEDTMIIDEFDGATMAPTFFNALADEHPCVLPVHGGAGHQMTSRYLFIGTNYLPREWWRKRNAQQVLQTTRRIDGYVKRFRVDSPDHPLGLAPQMHFDFFQGMH